jgi:pimeloyl-ACP methyl ester carboxylesterase
MVLIEGDGKAYLNRTTISPNPTPQHPIALQLAAKSRHANVLYLARPCQFVDVNQAPHCTPKVWTTHRYNQTVVDATHDALKLHLKHHPAQGIHFVGFSGGALIAASLATSRADTLSLQTVAGNLDVQAFTTHHNISPLPNSVQLNKAFNTLKNIPQIHFTGGADKVIPTHLIAHFLTTFKHNKHCIQHINIPGANHQTLWEKITLDFSHSTQCRSEQSVESL